MEKYHVKNVSNVPEIQEKKKQTFMEHYGYDHNWKSPEVRQKAIETSRVRYGYDHCNQSPERKQYYTDLMLTDQMQEKINKSKEENNSFNTSSIEVLFENYLKQYFPNDYVFQYKSKVYPFNCDFYIKSADLYIEIQGYWGHGGKPFENTEEDNKLLDLWKSKSGPQYKNAIIIWTVSDVKKRNIAKENNLNYLEIFSWKLNDCIEKLTEYFNGRY